MERSYYLRVCYMAVIQLQAKSKDYYATHENQSCYQYLVLFTRDHDASYYHERYVSCLHENQKNVHQHHGIKPGVEVSGCIMKFLIEEAKIPPSTGKNLLTIHNLILYQIYLLI